MRNFLFLIVLTTGCDEPPKGSNGSNGSKPSGSGSTSCVPSSPGTLFNDALCLCGGLRDIGNLIVDGAAGVDGVSRLANHTDIADSFSIGADLDVAGDLEVHKDLSVGGDLMGIGRVAVGGVLGIAGADDMIGFQQAASRGSAGSAPPCACDQPFDVAAAVAAARSSSSVVALSAIGLESLTLSSGNYYSGDAATLGYRRLHVTGAVSLFVDGTLDEIGADRILIDPGATLDLYVSGGVATVGWAGLGDQNSPASFRLYVGSAAPLTLSVGAAWFHGSIYAPRANIVYVGDTHVAGGLFAHELSGTGQLVIHGALPGSSGGGSCPPLPPVG